MSGHVPYLVNQDLGLLVFRLPQAITEIPVSGDSNSMAMAPQKTGRAFDQVLPLVAIFPDHQKLEPQMVGFLHPPCKAQVQQAVREVYPLQLGARVVAHCCD